MRLFIVTILVLIGSHGFCADNPSEDFKSRSQNQNVYKRRSEIIVLDAGHGGKDYGTMNKALGYDEKSLTLSMTIAVQNHLKRLGYRSVLTRGSDVFVTLGKRASIANGLKAHAFVSIHCNHSENLEALGTEIYFYDKGQHDKTTLSEELGKKVLLFMEKAGIMRSRGVKAGNFSVIRETVMPSILVETGFLSNPGERAKLLNPIYRASIAKGIAEGIHTFLTEKEQSKQRKKSLSFEKRTPLQNKAKTYDANRPRRDSNTWPAA